MNQWSLIFITAIISIPAGILLHILKQKYDARSVLPKVVISRTVVNDAAYVQVNNIGPEGIIEFHLKYSWLQDGKLYDRDVKQFFQEGQDIVMSYPQNLSYINIGKTLIASSLPQISDDEKVKVVCTGAGETSNKKLVVEQNIIVGRRSN